MFDARYVVSLHSEHVKAAVNLSATAGFSAEACQALTGLSTYSRFTWRGCQQKHSIGDSMLP